MARNAGGGKRRADGGAAAPKRSDGRPRAAKAAVPAAPPEEGAVPAAAAAAVRREAAAELPVNGSPEYWSALQRGWAAVRAARAAALDGRRDEALAIVGGEPMARSILRARPDLAP